MRGLGHAGQHGQAAEHPHSLRERARDAPIQITVSDVILHSCTCTHTQ